MNDFGINVEFEDWIKGWATPAPSTYQKSDSLAFQRWFRFKEAFSPTLVRQVIDSLPSEPRHILDCFGGSGTTAVVARMLGISSSLIEVNPFLADVIQAKMDDYNDVDLPSITKQILDRSLAIDIGQDQLRAKLPPTFVEPGYKDRWLFSIEAIQAIEQLKLAIAELESEKLKRFFTVGLGSILIDASNVRIDGKARRYRTKWQERFVSKSNIRSMFIEAVSSMVEDVARFPKNNLISHNLFRGDSRKLLKTEISQPVDLAIFSPPYPNSFDYTDIYNVELWVLGYISSASQNKILRMETMRSHVQVAWDPSLKSLKSSTLDNTIALLNNKRDKLWNSKLVEMIYAYFEDLDEILNGIVPNLASNGTIAIVVGNSSYVGITVDSSEILKELAANKGLRIVSCESVRVMRASSQQTAETKSLDEWLILLRHI